MDNMTITQPSAFLTDEALKIIVDILLFVSKKGEESHEPATSDIKAA